MTVKKPVVTPKPARKGLSVVQKKRTDWQAVERDFRTATFTLRELAEKYEISHQAIAKQAKKNEWSQDLTRAIKQATNAKLVNQLVDKEVAKSGQAVANTVLAAAEINKDVILGHRKGLNRLTAIKATLLGQIEQAAANMEDLADVIAMVRNEDDNGMDRANDALRKSMGRSALVDDLKKLADVDEKVRKGEREAFGLNDATPEKSPLDSLLKAICSGNNSAFGVVHEDPDHAED
jgi:predicted DNA-binding protein YlxM (UPF0122 family)